MSNMISSIKSLITFVLVFFTFSSVFCQKENYVSNPDSKNPGFTSSQKILEPTITSKNDRKFDEVFENLFHELQSFEFTRQEILLHSEKKQDELQRLDKQIMELLMTKVDNVDEFLNCDIYMAFKQNPNFRPKIK